MKYLRKFNESISGDLDFETFKEIMFELSDYFSCTFNDYSKSEKGLTQSEGFYDCCMIIPSNNKYQLHDDIPYLNFDYLQEEIIRPLDDPDDIQNLFENDIIFEAIDSQSDELSDLKANLDDIIDKNNKLKEVFKNIKEHILPRFEAFSNFLQSDIGFDGESLRITFEIKLD